MAAVEFLPAYQGSAVECSARPELLAAVAASRVQQTRRPQRPAPLLSSNPSKSRGDGSSNRTDSASAFDHETIAHLLFQEIDVDNSGTLEPEELASLSRQLGHPLSAEELTAAMTEMDADGNGHVDFDEFLQW